MNESSVSSQFHVKVGLAQCTVSCQSEGEAVRMARAELGRQMPSMTVILAGIADKEFRVDRV